MPDREIPPTLFERIVARLGFDRTDVSVLTSPLVLWALGFVVFDVVVLQGYKQLQGYTATFLTNPAWLIQPAFAIVGAVAVEYLHAHYARALDHADVDTRTTDPGRFDEIAPVRLRAALYLVAFGYNYWGLVVNIGIAKVLAIGGIAELVGVAVVSPLGYGIIFAEFLATYVGIMLLLPRKIRQTDFRIDFLDPEGLGGLRPVGELMKAAYYFIVLGLVGYVVFTYGPFVLGKVVQTSYPRPTFAINAAFTLGWLVTIATMAYGLSQLHWFMKRKKREELSRLTRRARELVENPYDVSEFEITNDEQFDDLRRRMDYVNNTREYPTTFTMWSQILITLVLPKAIQMALKAA